MLYSNTRKLILSGWLKNYNKSTYSNSLRLQKFLFFYEAFSKVDGDNEADFSNLKGYKNGPVFSKVWGDYTKEGFAFEYEAEDCFEKNSEKVNNNRATQCAFLVATLSENELSTLTHAMNIWKSQEKLINAGISQVPLHEKDFNQDDFEIIRNLQAMYPVALINSSKIIPIDNIYFVIKNEKFKELKEQHFDILSMIVKNEELHNPVFIDIDESGRLVID